MSYGVYVKTDSSGYITDIKSDIFISESDLTNWTKVDSGEGDKYAHAQGNYLDKGLYDSNSCSNYKLVDGVVTERTEDEKTAEIAVRTTVPTFEERIAALETAQIAALGV